MASPPLSIDLTAPNGHKFTLPTGLFINNEFVTSTPPQLLPSINPTNEQEICSVHAASPTDVDHAVHAARTALHHPSWRDLPATDRGALMYQLATAIETHAETLATIETWDNGKPYSVALGEDLVEVASCLRYYAGWADKIAGQTIATTAQKFAFTLRQPVGVVGQIIPWNYPLAMAAWKLGPALACGNTVVIKAAEQTPLSILYLAKLIKEVGFPAGVVNILNGYGREAGAAIAGHMDIDKVAFTGSTATGKLVMKMAAGNLKNITLETGGKSPLLVFDDADLEQAARWAHVGIMSNQGQICTATSRLLIQSTIYDAFLTHFQTTITAASHLGDPFSPTTTHGPQVSRTQYERVLSYIAAGQAEGATLTSGGHPAPPPTSHGKGFFIQPTVFTDVTPEMSIYRDEVFGPCVVMTRFETEDQALRMANDTAYGLGGAVFTRDVERALRVAARIDAGMVWVNSSNDSDFRVPFGGVKQSGVGRELGEAGLDAYCQTKAVHVNMGLRL